MLFLDPPYRYMRQKSQLSKGNLLGFKNSYGITSDLDSVKKVIELYKAGIIEAKRVLSKSGYLVIKCQDQSDGAKNYMVHVDLINFCMDNGFSVQDLFIVQNKQVIVRWDKENQKCA